MTLHEFLIDLFRQELGPVLARASVGGREVTLHADLDDPSSCTEGTSFQPFVHMRIDGEEALEGAANVDVLLDQWFAAPLPDMKSLLEAKRQLQGWQSLMARRLGQIPEELLEDTAPALDLSYAPGPLLLAFTTLTEGPPPARPSAGSISKRARDTAKKIAVIEHDPDAGEVCAFEIDGYEIRIEHTPDDADEPQGWIKIVREGVVAPILYSNGCERADAYSVDGNEPLFRLFSDWLIAAIAAAKLDEPGFPDPRFDYPPFSLSSWLRFGDHEGAPLDHRIDGGVIRELSYDRIDVPDLTDDILEAMPATRAIYHQFMRDIVDPECDLTQSPS